MFNSDISFLINKKSETIEKYTSLFDEKFFNLLLIFSIINNYIFFDNKIKKILFSKNFFKFKTADDDISYLYKFNLNYLIAIAAGLGLYLELMIIRLHSSFFQLFGF